MSDGAGETLLVIEGAKEGFFLQTKPRTHWEAGDGNTPERALSKIPAGWSKVAVFAGNKDQRRYKFYTLKPAREENALLQSPDYEVRGRFEFDQIVEDNPERALELWTEYDPKKQ
jgi:hypothetical protein